jgi:hypothetical protein
MQIEDLPYSYTSCCTSNTAHNICTQSHVPSFQPVLHLSSHLEQSNSFFPSFLLTSLWASHIHCPNSCRLSALTLFFSRNSWKSSAHTQQGYIFENRARNCLTWPCSALVGEDGYEAVMEWRSVQEDRPSSSTSGGQSGGGPVTAWGWLALALITFLVCEAQSAREVQDRQLGGLLD